MKATTVLENNASMVEAQESMLKAILRNGSNAVN
jgi:hypothetical protein